MEATENCTIMIGATQGARLYANRVIETIYEGYFSHSAVVQYLVMPHVRYVYVLLPLARPHVRHVCVLLYLVMLHIRHAHLGLHIAVSLKGRTT